MSRAVLHAARGSRPAVPGRGATAPNVRRSHQLSLAAGGNAHLATHHQPKRGFKLNASVAAPVPIGPRPAGRLAYARCRTGARASAGKTLASSLTSSKTSIVAVLSSRAGYSCNCVSHFMPK